jgi:hypothetical protein
VLSNRDVVDIDVHIGVDVGVEIDGDVDVVSYTTALVKRDL